jgi:hypothetical protein
MLTQCASCALPPTERIPNPSAPRIPVCRQPSPSATQKWKSTDPHNLCPWNLWFPESQHCGLHSPSTALSYLSQNPSVTTFVATMCSHDIELFLGHPPGHIFRCHSPILLALPSWIPPVLLLTAAGVNLSTTTIQVTLRWIVDPIDIHWHHQSTTGSLFPCALICIHCSNPNIQNRSTIRRVGRTSWSTIGSGPRGSTGVHLLGRRSQKVLHWFGATWRYGSPPLVEVGF